MTDNSVGLISSWPPIHRIIIPHLKTIPDKRQDNIAHPHGTQGQPYPHQPMKTRYLNGAPLRLCIVSKRNVFLGLSLGGISFRWRLLVVMEDDFNPLAANIGTRHTLDEYNTWGQVLDDLASGWDNRLSCSWRLLREDVC